MSFFSSSASRGCSVCKKSEIEPATFRGPWSLHKNCELSHNESLIVARLPFLPGACQVCIISGRYVVAYCLAAGRGSPYPLLTACPKLFFSFPNPNPKSRIRTFQSLFKTRKEHNILGRVSSPNPGVPSIFLRRATWQAFEFDLDLDLDKSSAVPAILPYPSRTEGLRATSKTIPP